jgi:lysophospholipase L1-like esterase
VQKPWDRENAHSRQYVDQLRSLAYKHKAGFVNIFDEWQKDPSWADKLLLPDKLHLSTEGNQLLWKQMQEVIAAQVAPMAWENVALHYPLMDAIDKVGGVV